MLRPCLAPGIAHDLFDDGAGRALEADGDVHQTGQVAIVTQVVPQDSKARLHIRKLDPDVLAEATGPEDGGVDFVGKVSCANDYDAFASIDTVETLKKGVDDLTDVIFVFPDAVLRSPKLSSSSMNKMQGASLRATSNAPRMALRRSFR